MIGTGTLDDNHGNFNFADRISVVPEIGTRYKHERDGMKFIVDLLTEQEAESVQ